LKPFNSDCVRKGTEFRRVAKIYYYDLHVPWKKESHTGLEGHKGE